MKLFVDRLVLVSALSLFVSFTACTEEETESADDHAAEHICHHFEDLTKTTAITASSAANAPTLDKDHTLYKITLDKTNTNVVKINASKAAELVIVSNDKALTVKASQNGTAITEEKSNNPKCAVYHHAFDIEAVGIVEFTLSSTNADSIVLYEYADHDHADHDHDHDH